MTQNYCPENLLYEFCVWRSLVAAKFVFAAKIMFIPYKKDSDAYDNSTLLCGEKDFAATGRPPLQTPST